MVTAEHLVGTLPALHHLAVTFNRWRADRNRCHGSPWACSWPRWPRQAGSSLASGTKCVMHRTKALRDDIGVFELVALSPPRPSEADVVGTHVGNPARTSGPRSGWNPRHRTARPPPTSATGGGAHRNAQGEQHVAPVVKRAAFIFRRTAVLQRPESAFHCGARPARHASGCRAPVCTP